MTPSVAQRRAMPTASSTSAAFDCAYATHGSYGRRSKCGSSKSNGAPSCAPELTMTTRASPACRRFSCRPAISAKCPRKFVASCSSQPLAASRRVGKAMIPAFATIACTGPVQPATNARTEPRSLKSRACWSPTGLRVATVTSAPAPRRASTVSAPIPEAPPVTMIRRPVRSTPVRISAAVVRTLYGVLMRFMATTLRRRGWTWNASESTIVE